MVEMNNAADNMVGAPVPGRLATDMGVSPRTAPTRLLTREMLPVPRTLHPSVAITAAIPSRTPPASTVEYSDTVTFPFSRCQPRRQTRKTGLFMSFPHRQRVTPIAKHLPGFTTDAPPSETGAASVRSEVRLRVKPNTAARGYVDGAWWARSHDPAAEFPGLVLAMSSWVGPVRRVVYRLDDWHPTTPELTVEGWLVSLSGSSTLQANGRGGRHRTAPDGLLVIPPHTPGDIARAVLRSTARPDAVGSVEDILASHGICHPNGTGSSGDWRHSGRSCGPFRTHR